MPPSVQIEQEAVRRGGTPERWRVRWRVENTGDEPLEILAARCPHGKFRCEEKDYSPPLDLEANRDGEIELEVRCGEPAGSVVENAFVIVRALWRGKAWLIFARLRVLVDDAGVPGTATELITTQPVGFSRRQKEG